MVNLILPFRNVEKQCESANIFVAFKYKLPVFWQHLKNIWLAAALQSSYYTLYTFF